MIVPQRPSLEELLQLIARAWPEDSCFTTASPIRFITSDGAVVVVTVVKQTDDIEPSPAA